MKKFYTEVGQVFIKNIIIIYHNNGSIGMITTAVTPSQKAVHGSQLT
jgi:hypothetical protein